jgi:hypothetical protein
MRKIRLVPVTLTGLILLGAAAPGSALAADPTPSNANYGGVGGNGALGDTTHVARTAGSLPFTGANLIVYIVAGAGMAGTGIALRRSAAPKP